jgi:hypothetical protein
VPAADDQSGQFRPDIGRPPTAGSGAQIGGYVRVFNMDRRRAKEWRWPPPGSSAGRPPGRSGWPSVRDVLCRTGLNAAYLR